MPTYEYVCPRCGNRFDVVQRIDDEPLTRCEVCGGTLRKVFHPAGIVFKGSGFYATDSRSSKKGAGKEAASASKDASKDSSKDAASSGASPSSDSSRSGSSTGSGGSSSSSEKRA